MIEKNHKTGRTFWDVVSEHKIVSLLLLLLLVGLLLFLVFRKTRMNLWGLEINPTPDTVHEIIIKNRIDTQYFSKPTLPTKAPVIKKIVTPPPLTKDKKIMVKKGDTTVTVENQPANVNTGTNNGIIGNNNAIKLNVNSIKRSLNIVEQQKLLSLVDDEYKKIIGVTDTCISIASVTGNTDAFELSKTIELFLKTKFKNVSAGGQFQRSPPINGVKVGTDGKCVTISVGYLKPL